MIQDKIKELYLSLRKEDLEVLLKELQIASFDSPSPEIPVDSCPHCQSIRVIKVGHTPRGAAVSVQRMCANFWGNP